LLTCIYQLIEAHPGCKSSWVGKHFGLRNVDGKLIAMQNNGFLVAEDPRNGGLYPFRKPGDTARLI
jgi:hypothetical protein